MSQDMHFDQSVRFVPSTLTTTAFAVADELESLLPRLRELSGRRGRVNDPTTVRIAQIIVSLRDAAGQGS